MRTYDDLGQIQEMIADMAFAMERGKEEYDSGRLSCNDERDVEYELYALGLAKEALIDYTIRAKREDGIFIPTIAKLTAGQRDTLKAKVMAAMKTRLYREQIIRDLF